LSGHPKDAFCLEPPTRSAWPHAAIRLNPKHHLRGSSEEEGWLLAELEQRFSYGLEELARLFDRSVSWVSRRLALVELLPDSVQQQVRSGEISAQVAMRYLVPVARRSLEDCQQMAAAFARHKLSVAIHSVPFGPSPISREVCYLIKTACIPSLSN
jgi:hypothetical protein